MKHHSIRRYLTVLLTLGFMVVPALAAADTIQYVERRWTGTAVESETKMKTDVAEFPESTSVAEEIYVVKQNRTINGRVSLVGDTEIILMDDCTLNVKGLYIPEGSTLTIYAQSDGKNAGKIISKPSDGTGIGAYAGSDHKGGEIVIQGGMIEATGGKHCAGIGSNDDNGTTSPITIYGGTITAKGGEDGAGIGGGRKCDGGTIKIYGGTIIAKGGGENGAGIGGGDNGDGGTITINGGTIHVYSRDGAGIGGGDSGDGGTITGGYIYTHPQGQGNGAGIGGGNNAGGGGTITIKGGYVDAASKHGAGIGGGQEDEYLQFADNSGAGAKLTIEGGEVHATAQYAFGIGCGGPWFENDAFKVIGPDINGELYGTAGTITISGENTKVYATGVPGGIGGDSGNLTIEGGEVHAEGGTFDGKRTGHGIYMDGSSSRISIRGGTVYANGYGKGDYSAYLGEVYAGISTQASAVEITGGKVYASAQDGPGIGGIEADGSMHGSLLISGPYTAVHASSDNNVGIGCSDWDNGKAKWTFGREATIEVTSGGSSDKIKNNSVPISEVGAKITAGSSIYNAKLLTVKEKETAHSAHKYRRIELCAHEQEQADEVGKCAYCGGKEGYCYVAYEFDRDITYMVDLVQFGDCTTPPASSKIPFRSGYEFKYWYEVTGAEDTVAGSEFNFSKGVGKDLILRAKWVHKHDGGTDFEPWYSGDQPARGTARGTRKILTT